MEFNKDGKKFVLELKENKKKYNPKKVPKKLYIKIKTNIEKFKRINFNQKMISQNSPGENYLYFMKYYPLLKKYFDDYPKQNRFQLFFKKDNILRTTIRKTPADKPEYVYKNIQFIIDNVFSRNEKIYLNSQPFSIFSSYWDKNVYKTNSPHIYQIDLNLTLARGDKLTSADNFQLSCNQRTIEIAEDVDLIFSNLIDYAKSFTTSTQYQDNKEIRKLWSINQDATAPPIAKVEQIININ